MDKDNTYYELVYLTSGTEGRQLALGEVERAVYCRYPDKIMTILGFNNALRATIYGGLMYEEE